MSVDYLSSLKIGSGLNTTQIIDAIVDAERAPKADLISRSKEKDGRNFRSWTGETGF